jgi:hypothetical protein
MATPDTPQGLRWKRGMRRTFFKWKTHRANSASQCGEIDTTARPSRLNAGTIRLWAAAATLLTAAATAGMHGQTSEPPDGHSNLARKEPLIDLYRDVVRFKRGAGVLAIGLFGDPPSVADLAALPLDTRDVNLRDCRVGHCDIRLPASAIVRFQSEIDWTATDADARAATLFRQILADNVRTYVSGGAGRISEYDDEKRPVRPVNDFSSLLKGSPYVDELVPGLAAHLEGYSTNPLPRSEDIVYWSKETFGDLDPFVTVTHVTITQPVRVGRVIASRDVYSSRYLDASLSVTIACDAASTPDAFYLVYINRSRADALKGAAADLRRSIVERRAMSGIEENLKLTKLRLEGPAAK